MNMNLLMKLLYRNLNCRLFILNFVCKQSANGLSKVQQSPIYIQGCINQKTKSHWIYHPTLWAMSCKSKLRLSVCRTAYMCIYIHIALFIISSCCKMLFLAHV